MTTEACKGSYWSSPYQGPCWVCECCAEHGCNDPAKHCHRVSPLATGKPWERTSLPAEPTRAMLDAWADEMRGVAYHRPSTTWPGLHYSDHESLMVNAYQAMLSAAPPESRLSATATHELPPMPSELLLLADDPLIGAAIVKWGRDIQASRSVTANVEPTELAQHVALHSLLQNVVSLLLGSAVPIGPMHDRKDYPPELQSAVEYLKDLAEGNAKGIVKCVPDASIVALARKSIEHSDGSPDAGCGCNTCIVARELLRISATDSTSRT